MKNTPFLLLFIWFTNILMAQSTQNVVYGERSKYFEPNENINRFFFDKNGDLYPNVFISDQNLIKNEASLKIFYSKNDAEFIEAAKGVGLGFDSFTEVNYQLFQKVLINTYISKLNKEIDEHTHLYLLIHGFRKPIYPKRGSTSAQGDNISVENVIISQQKEGADVKFIEIYWDAMYDCCAGFKPKTNKRLLELFENEAQNNAVIVGYSLRRVVSKIDISHFTIITHSLGAQVGISVLMNAYDNKIDDLKQNWATPAQPQIDICLIAPAMSKEPLGAYYDRTTILDFKEKDNYNLTIFYNEKDIVLRKKILFFGPGARKYGNTTLGCNSRKEIEKLKDMFKNDLDGANINCIHSAIGKPHLLRLYARSSWFENYIKNGLEGG